MTWTISSTRVKIDQFSFEEETIGLARSGAYWCPAASLFMVPRARLRHQAALPEVTRAFPPPSLLVLRRPASVLLSFVPGVYVLCGPASLRGCALCPCCSFVWVFVSRQQRRRTACVPFSSIPSRDPSANRAPPDAPHLLHSRSSRGCSQPLLLLWRARRRLQPPAQPLPPRPPRPSHLSSFAVRADAG